MSAYVGSSKNLKDLKERRCVFGRWALSVEVWVLTGGPGDGGYLPGGLVLARGARLTCSSTQGLSIPQSKVIFG